MPALATGFTVSRAHPDLPIFEIAGKDGTFYYAPGALVVAQPGAVAALEPHARAVHDAWHAQAHRPFEPECLTLYLSNKCNLACSYCYSAPQDPLRRAWRLTPLPASGTANPFPTLEPAAVEAAADVVARHCVRKQKRFSLVFHGGGEPTLHWDLLQDLHARVAAVAGRYGLDYWSYVATNGVLAESRVHWLAERFSLVGLSCDGPPDIQDLHRPSGSRAGSSTAVERTARALRRGGVEFHVRATITRGSLYRQTEVASYCIERLGARTVRFEPAYQARPGEPAYLTPDDAEAFVEGLLDARRLAARLGADLQASGVRIDEVHGPYCNPLRDVLQLGPTGTASACFLTADGDCPDDDEMAIGRYDAAAGVFEVNAAKASAFRARGARVPGRCWSCVNVYHCARDCPDVCLITDDRTPEATPGFRCRAQMLLAHALIRDAAQAARTLQGA